jgi:hypothetical protein
VLDADGGCHLDDHRLGGLVGDLHSVCKMRARTLNSKRERFPMTWSKPKFEFIEMCSEVTSYLYHR